MWTHRAGDGLLVCPAGPRVSRPAHVRAPTRTAVPFRVARFPVPRRRVVAPGASVSDESKSGGGAPPPPPVVPPLPVVGNWDLLKDLNRTHINIEKLFTKNGYRAMSLEVLGTKVTHFRHPDDAAYILKKNQDAFPKSYAFMQLISGWLGKGSLVTQQSKTIHKMQRDVMNPAFRQDYIRTLIPEMAQVAETLVRTVQSHESEAIDFEDFFKRGTLDALGRVGLQHDFGAVRKFNADAQESTDGGGMDVTEVLGNIGEGAMARLLQLPVPDSVRPGIRKYEANIALIDDVIYDVLSLRRARGLEDKDRDLLSYLLRQQEADGEDGFFTDSQIRDELQTMIFAGSDTTAITLAYMFYYLSINPEIQTNVLEEIQAKIGDKPLSELGFQELSELEWLNAAINETLRLEPPAPTILRQCSGEGVQVGPHSVPDGRVIGVNIYAMHRWEEVWPRGSEWLPQRWLEEGADELGPRYSVQDAFMPFAAGNRSCIGRSLSLLEAQIFTLALLRTFELRPVAGYEPNRILKFTQSSVDGVLAIPVARQPTGASVLAGAAAGEAMEQ